MAGDLVSTLADLKEKEALGMVQERLDSGDDPMAMIGGGVVDENLIPYVGADGFEPYASGAVTLSREWLGID